MHKLVKSCSQLLLDLPKTVGKLWFDNSTTTSSTQPFQQFYAPLYPYPDTMIPSVSSSFCTVSPGLINKTSIFKKGL